MLAPGAEPKAPHTSQGVTPASQPPTPVPATPVPATPVPAVTAAAAGTSTATGAPAPGRKDNSKAACDCDPAEELSPFVTCVIDETGLHVKDKRLSAMAKMMAEQDDIFNQKHVCKVNSAFRCVCCDCDTKDEPAHIAALGDGLSWVKAPFLLKGKVR
jgi:hypothetical protein